MAANPSEDASKPSEARRHLLKQATQQSLCNGGGGGSGNKKKNIYIFPSTSSAIEGQLQFRTAKAVTPHPQFFTARPVTGYCLQPFPQIISTFRAQLFLKEIISGGKEIAYSWTWYYYNNELKQRKTVTLHNLKCITYCPRSQKKNSLNTETSQSINVTRCQLTQYGLNATTWAMNTHCPFKNKEHG